MYNSVIVYLEIARIFTVDCKVPHDKKGQQEVALNIIIKP